MTRKAAGMVGVGDKVVVVSGEDTAYLIWCEETAACVGEEHVVTYADNEVCDLNGVPDIGFAPEWLRVIEKAPAADSVRDAMDGTRKG